MKNQDKIEARMIKLETDLGLLQHDFESQNEMILLNTRMLKGLEKRIEWLVSELEQLRNDEGPESLEDQVPPHY